MHEASSREAIAQRKVAAVLTPVAVFRMTPLVPGYSGAQVFKVTTNRGTYFAKVVVDWRDIEKPDEFKAEITNSLRAGQAGVGPMVIAADGERGVLITELLDHQTHDGVANPQPILATMEALHHSAAPKDPYIPRVEELTQRFWDDFSKVPAADLDDPVIQRAEHVLQLAVSHLITLPFAPQPCHGDLHADNILFKDGRAIFIDWGGYAFGDAMQELAYYAYHVDLDVSELESWAPLYPSASFEDIERAKSYLAIMHAERYLQTLRGMPWDKAEERGAKLNQHAVWLAQDESLLSQRVRLGTRTE